MNRAFRVQFEKKFGIITQVYLHPGRDQCLKATMKRDEKSGEWKMPVTFIEHLNTDVQTPIGVPEPPRQLDLNGVELLGRETKVLLKLLHLLHDRLVGSTKDPSEILQEGFISEDEIDKLRECAAS